MCVLITSSLTELAVFSIKLFPAALSKNFVSQLTWSPDKQTMSCFSVLISASILVVITWLTD